MSKIHAVAKLPEINSYIKQKHGKRRALTPSEVSILREEGNAQMRVIRQNWPVRTGASRAAWRLQVRGRPGDDTVSEDIPERDPDIAFWFDEEDPTLMLVKVKEGIRHMNLLQAYHDLLSRALNLDPDTVIAEWKRDE